MNIVEQLSKSLCDHVQQDHAVEPSGLLGKASKVQIPNVRETLGKLRSFLKGDYSVRDGVNLKSKGTLDLRMSLDGDNIKIEFLNDKPEVDIRYIIKIVSSLNGILANDNSITLNLNGLPDPTFEVIS